MGNCCGHPKADAGPVAAGSSFHQLPSTPASKAPAAQTNGRAYAAKLEEHLASNGSNLHPGPRLSNPGDAEDEDYHSCKDDFSTTDGSHLGDLVQTPRMPGGIGSRSLNHHGSHSQGRLVHAIHTEGTASAGGFRANGEQNVLLASPAPRPIVVGEPAPMSAVYTAAPGDPAAVAAAAAAAAAGTAVQQQGPAVHLAAGTHERAAMAAAQQYPVAAHEQQAVDAVERISTQGISETESELGVMAPPQDANPLKRGLVGCLSILDNLSIGGNNPAPGESTSGMTSPGRVSRRGAPKPEAGCSMQRRDYSQNIMDVSRSYEDAGIHEFQVRSLDYMRSKLKVPSARPLYTLVAADVFHFQAKQNHIARLLHLPQTGNPVMAGDVALPPLIIFNLQLPLYQPPLFGTPDGPGLSIVFYFALPEGFDPAKVENQKALGLLKRFIQNGREQDGTPTRDRLKLVPRVVNVDEWVKKGPLSQAEHKLLLTYNEKPVLSRPQHSFFNGRRYFEVDLDLHTYSYLARRAIMSFVTRLPSVIWDNAFVIQGNSQDELPEQLLGAARMFRIDFMQAKPFDHYVALAAAAHPAQPDSEAPSKL